MRSAGSTMHIVLSTTSVSLPLYPTLFPSLFPLLFPSLYPLFALIVPSFAVFTFCAESAENVRKMMLAAHHLNMTQTGEFVFFNIDLEAGWDAWQPYIYIMYFLIRKWIIFSTKSILWKYFILWSSYFFRKIKYTSLEIGIFESVCEKYNKWINKVN